MLSKIRKPKVEEVSAFDDIHSGASFPQAEDPYAGKSFAEVLRLKREALEASLVTVNIAPATQAGSTQNTLAAEQQMPVVGANETLDDRKQRL